ncbi:MAG TPA: T9SS type A sorting domain-containing protein [Bacteroidia bacterium]|nr:T9SS type A sorting domain-containing protein [Bacteroidia bacterium]
MKKVMLPFAVLCFCFFNSFSQVVPNAGFENWDTTYLPQYEEPLGWTSNNPDITVPPTVTKSTDTCSGTYSVRMENMTFTNQISGLLDTAQGYIVSGDDLASYDIGFRDTVRVLSVDFCIKYTRAGTDSAELNLSFKKWNQTSQQSDQVSTQNCYLRVGSSSASFYSVSVPITYLSTFPPPNYQDTVIITLSPSGLTLSNPTITPGSVLWVDDIVFNYSTVGTGELDKDNSGLNVYPNPAHGEINFASLPAGSGSIRLMDITGREVSKVPVDGVRQSMSLKNISSGIYVYEIISAEGKVLTIGKVSVVE